NVVSVVAHGRGIERQKPDSGDAQLLEIIQFLDQSAEIAHPVAVAVAKGLNVQFVDYRILVPQRIDSCFASICCHTSNLCCIRRPVQSLGLHNWAASFNLIPFMHRKAKKRARVAKPTTRRFSAPPQLEPGAPTDLQLMHGIQAEDPDALSLLYDRYNGILKALILRVIHNEAEADDLLQEIFMEIWNQAKNFSAQKGKPLGWMVTLARRRAID